jgi:DNA polymerase-3 subunit alpha
MISILETSDESGRHVMSEGDHAAGAQSPFVHLRVHSSYSLLEGALHIEALIKLCRRHKIPALALTDTNNLYGALEFSEAAVKGGVQPIIGCTLAVDFADLGEEADNGRSQTVRTAHPSLVLIACNEEGYENLLRLSSSAFLDVEDGNDPHVTCDALAAASDGLICLTGGPGGPVNKCLVDRQAAKAGVRLERLREMFGDRLYVELQRHGSDEERVAEVDLVTLAYDLELPLVATNDVFFGERDDYDAHDALICISESTVVAAQDRRRLTHEHYFKSPDEMRLLFADIPEALEATCEIAQRCSYRPHTRDPILPNFGAAGAGMDEAEELRRQAQEGLEARLSALGMAEGASEEDYQKRLEYELNVITTMQFSGYFLIVADFIQWAKAKGIPVGPGRGSGAGSVIAWALTITDLDPLRFNLLFERFLNPERVSMPDFDIDFCQERRDEVISYVQERYGRDQVAQIITFGKLQARAVMRDVGRVLQVPYGLVDRLCKMIPNNPANPVTLAEAIDMEPRLQEARDTDELVAQLITVALKLEGLYRHASTHAAGLVIGDRRLDALVPLYRDPRSDMPVTQFNMKWVEKAGLVKFDFLGLKTLSVLDKACELIKARGVDIDLNAIPYDDEGTYALLAQGSTIGVFQLESSGMKDLIRKAEPGNIEDIIALVALYRPGPMENIPKYLAAKHGREAPEFLHERITPVVEDTYGVIIYQEQVMSIAQILSGYSLGEADLLRRAMGKKIKSEMDQQKSRFVEGAVELGVDRAQAEFIFELVAKFAGYGFNKAHSACYGVIAYQTAYLKANYPVEFLAASMTFEMGNTDKLYVFKQEAERIGVAVKPPAINRSEVDFIVDDGAIRYSLAAIKNVGKLAIEHIVELRRDGGPFTSLGDFARRVNPRVVNKRALENLVRAGAFDELWPERAQLLGGVETILAMANRSADERTGGQNDLFGGSGSEPQDLALQPMDGWLPMEQLAQEFDAVGFYLSGHPLDEYRTALVRTGVKLWQPFVHSIKNGGTAGKLAGTVIYKQERKSRQGNRFAFVGFSDPTGQFEAIVFADTLAVTRDLLEPGSAVILRVEATLDGDDVKVRVQQVEPLDKAAVDVASGLKIYIRDDAPLDSIAARLTNGGKSPVKLLVMVDGGARLVEIDLGDAFTVTPQIRGAIKAISGVEDVLEY